MAERRKLFVRLAKPGKEYVESLKKLLESWDNDRADLLQYDLQQLVQRESDRVGHSRSFIESYKDTVAAIHIHGTIRFPSGVRVKFCAVVKNICCLEAKPAGVSNYLTAINADAHDIQISVLVDIRELREKSQRGMNDGLTVVRLQRLDECISRLGNPRKSLGEYTVRERKLMGNGVIARGKGNVHKQGKIATLLPPRWEGDSPDITLDETERQVIEGRAHLVDHLSGQHGNIKGRVSGEFEVRGLFALRIDRDDFIRATGRVFGNATLERFEVFCSPGELPFRGL